MALAVKQINSIPVVTPNKSLDLSRLQDDLISDVAKKSLTELGVTLAFSAATAFFVTGSAVILPLGAIAIVAINTGLRGLSAYHTYKYKTLETVRPLKLEEVSDYSFFNEMMKRLRAKVFCYFDQYTRDLVTHEMGHAIAFKAFYEGTPKITIHPFGNGQTTVLNYTGLTKLGKALGDKRCDLISAGAGTGLSLLFALGNIAISHAVRKEHPELSTYLLTMAITSIAIHAMYALSGLYKQNASHDFGAMAAMGVHPLVAAAAIVAIPLIFKLGLEIYSSLSGE
jgi:hypothetical protein